MISVLQNIMSIMFLITGVILSSSSLVFSNDNKNTEDIKIIAHGKKIAVENCSRCHAVGLEGKSPHDKAPAFRELFKNYPLEDLTEALAEGIVSGHPDMPVFTFEPSDIDAFISYLKSLSYTP